MKERAERLVHRRQNDVKDQSLECSTGQSNLGFIFFQFFIHYFFMIKVNGTKKSIDASHEKRMIDREARRIEKNKNSSFLNEISTDDEEDSNTNDLFNQSRRKLV